MPEGASPAATAAVTVVALLAGWAVTVPLHRFKELRPKTHRDVSDEAGLDIRAVVRHARCPRCLRDHTPLDVVPVVSWIRGCPTCGRRMPATVWAAQILLASAAAVTLVRLEDPWLALPYLWLCLAVVSIGVVDTRIWLIPWWMPWVGAGVGFLLVVVGALALGDLRSILGALAGGAIAFGLLFVMWLLAPGRLGFGDVRLAAMLGLLLGWLHPILPIYGLLAGSLIGVLVGLVSLIAGSGDRFAFGPALGAGAIVVVWMQGSLVG